MKTKIFLFLTTLFLITSCEKRERTNPFDSGVPKELWTPYNFTATLEGTTVKLTWSQPVTLISGFKITKKVGDAVESALINQAKDASQLTDNELTGGKLHVYTIVAYAGNNQSNTVTAQVTPTLPANLTTTAAASITANSAILGGTITTDGGATITERGICWATTANPTTSTNKLAIGTGSGTFSNTVTGLLPATLYYFRAYAINSVGTAYGNEVTATTLAALPTITTTALSTVTSTTATSGGNITYEGISAVTARGVCWSTTPNPTIANSNTTDGTSAGTFTSSITGLLPGTAYYFRAYAINGVGTAYGNELTATTTAILPVLTTAVASSLTSSSVTIGGTITTDGGATVTARGVCWSTTQNPTTANSKTTNGTGSGTFVSSVTGLLPGTTYYISAYATNSIGTAYGTQVTITTTALAPTLTTTAISAITSTTATSGGNVTSDGGSAVTARGICWGTSPSPTISNSKTTDGTGSGTFTSSITGLLPGTAYYVRAYATNGVGTVYGAQVTFTTAVQVQIPALTTISGTAITTTTATSGGSITSDGGATVTAKGVCWSTVQNPTTANPKTTDGTGAGSFISSITGLAAGTTYYVRAYATNSIGTAYGDQMTITTTEPTVPIVFNPDLSYGTMTDIDGNVYKTITIGTQTWMAENLKTTKYRNGDAIANVTDNASWAALATGAYSWYNNDAATYKATYGALYNWYAVADSRNIAPAGWHVASDAEWTTLTTFLGGVSVAGGKLKETSTTHWLSPNTGATNSSGFTALPEGYRTYIDGRFIMFSGGMGYEGNWWSSTGMDAAGAWSRFLIYDSATFFQYGNRKVDGYSVRCVRD